MQILTFLLGEEKFALDIKLIDTIEYEMPITFVPRAKAYVKGLISIRGRILPVIDINMILNKENKHIESKKLIIVKVDQERLALAVSDIEDVLKVEETDIETICTDKETFVVNYEDNIMVLLTYEDLKKI